MTRRVGCRFGPYRPGKTVAMRAMFALYVLLIAGGLVIAIAVAIVSP